jgi:polyisoprenoid-binding protein YceI
MRAEGHRLPGKTAHVANHPESSMQSNNVVVAGDTLDEIPYLISRYEIDPAHASAQFKVRHLMVSAVRGELGQVTGIVMLDNEDITESFVHATIDVTAINTRNSDRDAHLRSADFLDVENHATITFESTRIEDGDPDRLRIYGDLTIRGVTKEVVLLAEVSEDIRDPWGNVKRGVSASTRIDRKEFGVSWNAVMDTGGVVVADMIDITIELELIRKPL